MTMRSFAAAALTVGLWGCGSHGAPGQVAPSDGGSSQAPVTTAVANLQTSEGKPAGTATATSKDGSMMLSLRVEGMPPGEHGVHVHMTGKCEGPKFESAGGHWNPGGKQHGLQNPNGQHAGDMPNLAIVDDGRGMITYALKGATIDGLLDADGSAMVIHAKPDDEKTDPSGNSGDRIACGVFGPA